MTVTLRPMVPGDAAAVLHVLVHAYSTLFDSGDSGTLAADFEASVRRGDETVFVAIMNAELVGTVALATSDLDGGLALPEGTVSLRRLAVHPSAWGFGVGRLLVKRALSTARSNGYRRVVLQTDEDMAAARQLYRTEGFIRNPDLDVDLGIGVRTIGLEHWLVEQ